MLRKIVLATSISLTHFVPPCLADEGPALLCRGAIARAEFARHIPDAFLSAIARVESGRPSGATGTIAPWPWTVNALGQGAFYNTKAEAVAAVQALQARGVRSIDVGCLQVNLMHHPDAFATLDQAFDPAVNVDYAAGLLIALFGQTGSWPRAAAAYHSQTPTIGADYQKKVLAEWAVPDRAIADRAMPGTGPNPAGEPAAAKPEARTQEAGPIRLPGAPPVLGFARAVHAGSPLNGMVGRDLASYRLIPRPMAFRPLRPSR